jgi:diguanylate cyclase (GGDEF)-like protein
MSDPKVTEALPDLKNDRDLLRVLDHMPVAVGLFDKAGRLLYMNAMFKEFHVYMQKGTIDDSFEDRISAGLFPGWDIDPAEYFARAASNLAETGEHIDQIEIDGRILCVHDVLIDDNLIISTQKDVTDRIKIEREIAYLASHDMMTGLANRASFEAQLAQTIVMNNHANGRFSVLMADLDRFKQINDTYGHPAGDEVLKEIACRFRASLGHNDFVARLGGDEFVFLCRGDENSTRALASRLAAAGQQPIRYDNTWLSVGVSVGYAIFPAHGCDQESLLRAADHALYQAKSMGHGIVQRYQPPEAAA